MEKKIYKKILLTEELTMFLDSVFDSFAYYIFCLVRNPMLTISNVLFECFAFYSIVYVCMFCWGGVFHNVTGKQI